MAITWIDQWNTHWREVDATQGKEFRIQDNVLEQHSLTSEHKPEFRVPYGMDGPEARQMAFDIDYRRKHGISLAGLKWPPSRDPYAPANDPHHPYYIG